MTLAALCWKLHRVSLKHSTHWFPLAVTAERVYQVRFRAEGSRYYIFDLRDHPRQVLRISKRHYYFGARAVEAKIMQRNLALYQALAAHGLAPRTQPLAGEACLVDCLPTTLPAVPPPHHGLVTDFFDRLRAFTKQTQTVITDFVADNFAVADGRMWLIDVEEAMSCLVAEAPTDPVVQQRLRDLPVIPSDPRDQVAAFYDREQHLLLASLER